MESITTTESAVLGLYTAPEIEAARKVIEKFPLRAGLTSYKGSFDVLRDRQRAETLRQELLIAPIKAAFED